ncbi:MAG: PPOX class F420-dependent oxidoreductase [Nitrososphaerales archaeon]
MKLSDNAKRVIDGKNFATVATLLPDGSPHVSPVWVDRDGDVILINSTRARQKTKNVKKDPRIAISIFDMTNPYSKTLIRGKVLEVTEKGAEEHIDKLSMKYTAKAKYPYHDAKDPRVLIRVEATRASE